ncbi:MAG TPA: 3-hydroxyacyl-CoA dehydrogenase/enoyl-CoA hydratase family protein [Burkholderiaceae bacterium]|nr:3-hydroxyacyl-CoA dehydrogenase/enoyl-CoA hydratase family protein [Burkholderiaceae bacterium]
MNKVNIKKVAVLGAGVMGAQIAGHCLNARVPVVLFDLPAKEGAKNGIVDKAIANLKKLSPAPLGDPNEAAFIEAANYETDLEKLKECDLVIEAIAERMDWKHDLYKKVTPFIAPHAVFASNTSGLSITQLSQGFDDTLRKRFCGVHFFNPPRYMHLVELIPTSQTDATILDQLEVFLTTTLGKGVVRAKDTPNFVANRVGVFSMLAVMAEGEKFGLGYDVIDDLTGTRLGRAKSATFRTADVVGLDTMAHVIKTMQDALSDDPFHSTYATPAVVKRLVEQGALGQKSGAGFYKKVGRDILKLDPASGEYVASGGKADEIIARMLKKPLAERFKLLRESSNPQAQFLWSIFRDVWQYIAVHLAEVADNARDIDFAIRWGFGWNEGPFETWQAAGWKQVAQWIQEDIDAGKTLSKAPLPAWVFEVDGVHRPDGSYSASRKTYVGRSTLPVYARQHFKQSVLGENAADPTKAGRTEFEDESIRLWTLDDEVLIASFKTKMNTIGPGVMTGLVKAVQLAEQKYCGLVVWQPTSLSGGPFSAGADLQSMMPAFMQGGAKAIEPIEKQLQDVMLALRYANVPTVAAISGIALGGGTELSVYCARRVAHFESYMGLVEIGVGLLPGAGGLTYMARRAAEQATGGDLMHFLKNYFQAAAMATVGKSALENRALGYLVPGDTIVMHGHELLHVAITTAKGMFEAGYRPPLRGQVFPVLGRSGIATIKSTLVNMRDGGYITPYDFSIASRIATVLCGGEVEAGSLVDEDTLLALERKHFGALVAEPKTQERIMGMLQTGKPVRN